MSAKSRLWKCFIVLAAFLAGIFISLVVGSQNYIQERSLSLSASQKLLFYMKDLLSPRDLIAAMGSGRFLSEESHRSDIPESLLESAAKLVKDEFESLRTQLREHYTDATERDLFWIFLSLKVSKSLPIYKPRPMINLNLYDILTDPVGNCSDHAIRLGILATLFGAEAYFVPINTSGMPGHVVAEIYDPIEEAGYLLDSNFGLIIKLSNPRRNSFFEELIFEPSRLALSFAADNPNLRIFTTPIMVEYVASRNGLDASEEFNANAFRLYGYHIRPNVHLDTIKNQMGEMVDWWKKSYPNQPRREVWNLLHVVSAFTDEPPRIVTLGNSLRLWDKIGISDLSKPDIEFTRIVTDHSTARPKGRH